VSRAALVTVSPLLWIPAFAGMTKEFRGLNGSGWEKCWPFWAVGSLSAGRVIVGLSLDGPGGLRPPLGVNVRVPWARRNFLKQNAKIPEWPSSFAYVAYGITDVQRITLLRGP
jgi:hypothetical protein